MVHIMRNKGINQTTISNQSHSKVIHEVKWDASYNGDKAYVKMDVNDNGNKMKYDTVLNNKQLKGIWNTMVSKSVKHKHTGGKRQKCKNKTLRKRCKNSNRIKQDQLVT